MKVRNDIVTERMFGCSEIHEKSPYVNWQRLHMNRHEAEYFPHVVHSWMHQFRSCPNTFSDKMVMLMVVKYNIIFNTSLYEASVSR